MTPDYHPGVPRPRRRLPAQPFRCDKCHQKIGEGPGREALVHRPTGGPYSVASCPRCGGTRFTLEVPRRAQA